MGARVLGLEMEELSPHIASNTQTKAGTIVRKCHQKRLKKCESEGFTDNFQMG